MDKLPTIIKPKELDEVSSRLLAIEISSMAVDDIRMFLSDLSAEFKSRAHQTIPGNSKEIFGQLAGEIKVAAEKFQAPQDRIPVGDIGIDPSH